VERGKSFEMIRIHHYHQIFVLLVLGLLFDLGGQRSKLNEFVGSGLLIRGEFLSSHTAKNNSPGIVHGRCLGVPAHARAQPVR
jgi:hypothetical protein